MRNLLIIVLALSSVVGLAAADLGSEFQFFNNHGRADINVHYWKNGAAVDFSLDRYTISKRQAVGAIYVQFVDKLTGGPLTEWFVSAHSSYGKDSLGSQPVSLSLSKENFKKFAGSIRTSVISVVATSPSNQRLFSGFIDLGNFCASGPDHFVNLDDASTGCP